MANSMPIATQDTDSVTQKRRIDGLGFDRWMAILSSWFTMGLFLDGWAHDHGFVDKTFFTPWHAILYSGYLATASLLLCAILINHSRNYRWSETIPPAYGLSLLGVPLFIIAGAGDLVWHILFGFEIGIEPLLSPTHLLLALGGVMMISGPLRAHWLRRDPTQASWSRLLPALLSSLAILSVFTFFTSFAHPIVSTNLVTEGTSDADKSAGVAAILLQTALLMGLLLYLLKRWQLPLGTFTLVVTVNTALMSVLSDEYRLIPAAFLAGLCIDLLYWRLRPTTQRVESLRAFAFATPVLFYLLYFATLNITQGIVWSIHLWLGSCILAGVIGLVLSFVLLPPPGPGDVADTND